MKATPWDDNEELRQAFKEEKLKAKPGYKPNGHANGHTNGHIGKPRIPMVHFTEMMPVLTGFSVVGRLLAPRQISVLYGGWGCGKTFMVLDIGLHIAIGERWLGRRVKKGIVVYIAAEAGQTIFNRVFGWRLERKLMEVEKSEVPFYGIPMQLDLRNEDGDINELIETIRYHCGDEIPVLIVIDTLNRVLAGGNENSGEDMGKVLHSAFRLKEEFDGVHVCIIHHVGKDPSRGARGHSSLLADVDTGIEVVANQETKISTATVVKQRDREIGDEIHFQLRQVFVGRREDIDEEDFDEDDENITTCVVEPLDPFDLARKEENDRNVELTPATYKHLGALMTLLEEDGTMLVADSDIPSGTRCVNYEIWRQYCYDTIKPKDGKPISQEAKQKAFKRASDELETRKRIKTHGKWVWLINCATKDRR